MSFRRFPTLFALAASISFAQTAPLSYNPTGAAYSKALDRLLLISTSDSALHVYDPVTNSDVAVPLAKPPLKISLGPDGTHAAIGHDGLISYVNLATPSVEKLLPVPVSASNLILGAGYVYLLPNLSVNLATGEITTKQGDTTQMQSAQGLYDAAQNAIYTTRPSIQKVDVSGGVLGSVTIPPNPTGALAYACEPVLVSQSGDRLYTRCNAINAASDPKSDMTYLTGFPTGSAWVDESAATRQLAATPITYTVDTSDFSHPKTIAHAAHVQLLSSDILSTQAEFTLQALQIDGKSVEPFGQWVFFNSTGTALYVVAQAYNVYTLIGSAVQTIPLGNPPICAVSPVQSGSGVIRAFGNTASFDVTADANCRYTARSNADWIRLAAPTYRSGNATLSYIVSPNPGSARTGTITIGTQTYTVQQEGFPATAPAPAPLSFHAVTAVYSKALDRLIATSANPDELHIINPVTLAEQVVALPRTPSVVAVRPDGLAAAVAHDGFASLVDLQSGKLTSVVRTGAGMPGSYPPFFGFVYAGNGYLYTFWSLGGNLCATEISSGLVTCSSGSLLSGLKLHPNGKRLAGVDNYSPKIFDITNGTPAYLTTQPPAGIYWFDENGTQVLAGSARAFGYSESPTDPWALLGSLSNTSNVAWADHSEKTKLFAVIPMLLNPYNPYPLEFYRDDNYVLSKELVIPKFEDETWPIYAFWNQQATSVVVVSERRPYARAYESGVSILPLNAGTGDCNLTLTPSDTKISYSGGYASLHLAFPSTAARCPWNVDSKPSWVALPKDVTFPMLTQSTDLGLIIDQNTDSNPRVGTITINGQSVTIHQGVLADIPVVSIGSTYFPKDGGSSTGTVTVSPTIPWSASSSVDWIQITYAPVPGSGSFTYKVLPNTGGIRMGQITAANQSFSIVQGSAIAPSSTGLTFIPITPCRAVDTRGDVGLSGPFAGPILEANTSRDFPLSSSRCGIPSSAQAYSVNVTVVPEFPLGYLTLWPTGQPQPNVSTLNSYDAQITANAAIVPAGAGGAISAFVTNRAHVIIDVNGYFDSQPNQGLAFYAAQPCRVADTRLADGPFGGPPISAESSRDFVIPSSSCNIPATAQAFSMNLTVVPQGPLYYVTAWPTGKPQPYVSTVNSLRGAVVANAAILPAGNNGAVSIAATQKTDVVLDVNGYFAPPGAPNALKFYPMTPCRAVDTRLSEYPAPNGAPYLPAYQTRTFSMTGGLCNVPPQARAFSLNVTALPHAPTLGFLSIWPAGTPKPEVSTLNSPLGQVIANAAIVPSCSGGAAACSNGDISVFVLNSADVVIDINGYFAP